MSSRERLDGEMFSRERLDAALLANSLSDGAKSSKLLIMQAIV